jgi:hypothetical protein
MRWVTRARPKTDRIACPWLLRRFIDQDAEILFMQPDDVVPTAAKDAKARSSMPRAPTTRTGLTNALSRCSSRSSNWDATLVSNGSPGSSMQLTSPTIWDPTRWVRDCWLSG